MVAHDDIPKKRSSLDSEALKQETNKQQTNNHHYNQPTNRTYFFLFVKKEAYLPYCYIRFVEKRRNNKRERERDLI
jgi:hypothetical protein